jgi:hypothetical protein
MIGSSCYMCDAPSSDAGSVPASARRSWDDDPEFPDSWETQGESSVETGADLVGAGDAPDSEESGRLGDAVDREFAEPPAAFIQDVPTPSGGGSGLGSGSVVRRALLGETFAGSIVSVSDPLYENVSLAAFNASQQAVTGCLTAPFRAIGIVMGVLFAPLRFLIGMGLMGGRGQQGAQSVQVPVHRFRVQDQLTGQYVECLLRGELGGGAIYLGEDVQVTGRFSRSTRVFAVSRLVTLSTGAVTTGVVDSRVRHQGVLSFLAIWLLLVVVFALWSMLR